MDGRNKQQKVSRMYSFIPVT